MKKLIIYIFLVLISFSCTEKDKTDYREPFKINQELSCSSLIDNGYTRIFGEDVFLIGKRTNDTLIYYYIEFPIKYDSSEIHGINEDIYPTDSLEISNHMKKICEKGTVYSRYYELELDSLKAFNIMREFDKSLYKMTPKKLDDITALYFKNAYQVINLIDKDTFDCSITKRDKKWLFETSITITNK